MSQVNMHEAKTHLSALVEAVESGVEREVVIARNGKPVARLVPLATQRKPLRLGVARGLFKVPETIDRDNAEIERLFYGDAD